MKNQGDVYKVFFRKYYRPLDVKKQTPEDKTKLVQLQNSKKSIIELYPVPPMPEYRKNSSSNQIDYSGRYQYYQILSESGYEVMPQQKRGYSATSTMRQQYSSQSPNRSLKLTFSGEKFVYRPSTGKSCNSNTCDQTY
ncbi:hypothetical protein SS50377_23456 [Spironucleus salmonicida]|uniref:Uncharacterized protein n=1 Tax=Spironucleus salmonicida TaxID=348837 RepID=V6LPN8_9EUKA|nr:hypothetical protein SS50377_23456 [Spironucleus salmonicida]|eukprot:EST46193.1 Hypothetical protein SS50377_13788 [Spironucleus salmonicida]